MSSGQGYYDMDTSEYKTGRSPRGRLRNYKAMEDDKFCVVYEQVHSEGNDPEAMAALATELRERFWLSVVEDGRLVRNR